jgi:ATP-dependent helicase/nuclease subunit B
LLELNSEILTHLRNGGTLLVPSRQRATAVRFAFSAAMLAEGRHLWSSPDVLPWTAWVERELDDARARGERLPRRLTSAEEWLLWQEAVQQTCAGFDVLMPDGMIEPVRRAVGLLDDYGLTLSASPTAEVAVLAQSMLHFRRRCEDWGALGRSSWRELSAWIRPSERLLIADPAAIGPERARWLRERGARIASAEGEAAPCQVVSHETSTNEAEAAANWCASQLAEDGAARLLVVVPGLTGKRHVWERAFSQRLDQALILAGRESSDQSGFVIEGGQPLTSYRLVTTALNLIALASASAGFDELSEVLRSPYQSNIPRETSLGLDRWLREHSVATADLSSLQLLTSRMGEDLGEPATIAVRQLLAALEPLGKMPSATAASWAQAWAAVLRSCGWPGVAPLSSDEQQGRMRFDELLGEFAGVQIPVRRLTLEEAASRLHAMAQRVSFQPSSEDVPVTITASLEDPIVRYDGIWVAGLSSDVWPPPAQPDPLLPLPLQYACGMARASAEGQSRLAQELQRCWQRSARRCVLSWSRSSEDLPLDRSPLLPQHGLADEAVTHRLCVPLEQWSAQQAPVLEAYRERTTAAVAVEGRLRGGTRLLELQSVCPFRSFAELRLQATPLEAPALGITPRVRGMILHKALELFWRTMRDQKSLAGSAAPATRDLIHDCVKRALQETLQREPGSVSAQVRSREHTRTTRVIDDLIAWELARPEFATTILEEPKRHEFVGAALDLQLDRVDRLEDGSQLIIDYKTGRPKTFDGAAERLAQPQLPAYAITAGGDVAGVVSLYLGRGGVKVRGSTDHRDRIYARLAPKQGEPTLAERIERWRQQLQQLVTEYLQGEASVHPLPDACKFCHLHALCRINPAKLAELDTDPDNPEGEESEDESDEEGE